MSETIDLLEADRSIRHTLLSMSRAVDEQDWTNVRACFSDTFSTFMSPDRSAASINADDSGVDTIRGADMMVSVMKEIATQNRAAGVTTMHVLEHIIVSVRGDEAEATALQTAYTYRVNEVSRPLSKSGTRHTFGLRREQATWKVASFATKRLWLEDR